jgi:hypothetical protein
VLRQPIESALAAAIGVHNDAGDLPAAEGHRHDQGAVGQLGIVVLAEGEPEHPAGGHVQHRGQVELAFCGLDLCAVAVPLGVDLLRREVALDQVRCPPAALSRPGGGPALLLAPGGQALLGHDRSDGVLADLPPGLAQVGGDPRGPVSAPVRGEQPPDLGRQRLPARLPRRELTVLCL